MSKKFVIHISYDIEMVLDRLTDEELTRCFTCDALPMTGEEVREYLRGLQAKGQMSICPGCPNITPEGRCGCPRG